MINALENHEVENVHGGFAATLAVPLGIAALAVKAAAYVSAGSTPPSSDGD